MDDAVCDKQAPLEEVTRKLPLEGEMQELANFFKVFGELSRIKILSTLYHKELCVCDLVEILAMNQSAVSHQLRVLRACKDR